MSYNLSIGEFDYKSIPSERRAVEIVQHEDGGPRNSMSLLDVFTSNRICPSYPEWREFCRDVGIYSIFYDGLWKGYHPLISAGRAQPLTEDHLEVFGEAEEEACKIPEWFDDGLPLEEREVCVNEIYAIRLRWLRFWTEWSLSNCEYPTFLNT